jgi:O-antigen/teichoic acid export membrane protein
MIGTREGVIAVLGMFFSMVIGAGTSMNCLLTGLRERRIVTLYQGLEPWMRLLVSLAAVTLIHRAGHVAILGFIGGTLFAVTLEARYALKARSGLRSVSEGPANDDRGEFREQLLNYGTPFILFAGFAAVTTYADRPLVLAYLDSPSLGIYVAMLQIANAPSQLTASITNQFFVPIIFERATVEVNVTRHSAAGRLIRTVLVVYGGTTVAFTLVAVFYAAEILGLFTTSEFKSHSDILWIMTLGVALANVGHTLSLTGIAQGHSRRYIAAKAAQTVAFFISAMALLERSGMEGMAWALCVSSVVYIAAVALTNVLTAPPETRR